MSVTISSDPLLLIFLIFFCLCLINIQRNHQKLQIMNQIIPGAQIGAFKTISLSIGQAKKANRDGKISKFLVIGMKNKKSLLGKKQNVILFDDDLSPEIFTVLQKYATPSADPNHQGGFDVNLANFKTGPEFAQDPDTWGQLLEFPGGCFEEYEFAKGPCYANQIDGSPTLDGNNQPVIRSSISVFVQIDFIDANGITHYIEPYSKNAQGARMEQRFFRNPVGQQPAAEQAAFDPTAMMGTQQPTATQQPAPQQPMAAPQVPPQQPTAPNAPQAPY